MLNLCPVYLTNSESIQFIYFLLGFEKIAYVSGSSTLTTHPSSLDQSPLRNTDCLIMTALTQTPTQNPDPMIVEFCKTVIETAKSGGNVLVPCYPAGIVYDLIGMFFSSKHNLHFYIHSFNIFFLFFRMFGWSNGN